MRNNCRVLDLHPVTIGGGGLSFSLNLLLEEARGRIVVGPIALRAILAELHQFQRKKPREFHNDANSKYGTIHTPIAAQLDCVSQVQFSKVIPSPQFTVGAHWAVRRGPPPGG